MNKILLIIILISFKISAQKITIKNTSGKSIPNVQIFSNDGEVIGISDIQGQATINSNEYKSLEFVHPEYNFLLMAKESIGETVILESVKNIDEIILTPISNKKFLHLISNFISYQLIDNIPQTFSNGIIVYTLDAKTMKIKNSTILEERILKNYEFLKLFQEKNRNRNITVGTNIKPFSFNEELLNSKILTIENGKINIDNKFNTITNNERLNISVVFNTPNNTQKRAFLGLKSEIIDYTLTENFNGTDFNLKNLNTISKYYHSNISQKNNSYKYELIQNINVIEVQYSNDITLSPRNTKNKHIDIIPQQIQKLILEKKLR